jgi:hypothetical protein
VPSNVGDRVRIANYYLTPTYKINTATLLEDILPSLSMTKLIVNIDGAFILSDIDFNYPLTIKI